MKSVKIIGIVLGVLLLALIVLGMIATKSYSVSRSVQIKSTDSSTYTFLSDWNNFQAWSPWLKLDSNAKVDISENSASIGSVFQWSGNDSVGSGKQVRIAQTPFSRIENELIFTTPWESKALTNFEILSVTPQTCSVTWTLLGKNDPISSVFIMLSGGMDEMMGPDYELGLKNLKQKLEQNK